MTRKSFLFFFLCIWCPDVAVVEGFFFQDVYFLHNQRLIFQRAGVSLSVTSWKLIYTVGKSSACAMIENTWMSGQIGERVCFVFLNSWIPTIDSEVYCICLCARESERERVLNIHLLHKRFLFQFQVPLVLCHRACGWMWENLKVTCFLIRLIVSVTFFFASW